MNWKTLLIGMTLFAFLLMMSIDDIGFQLASTLIR